MGCKVSNSIREEPWSSSLPAPLPPQSLVFDYEKLDNYTLSKINGLNGNPIITNSDESVLNNTLQIKNVPMSLSNTTPLNFDRRLSSSEILTNRSNTEPLDFNKNHEFSDGFPTRTNSVDYLTQTKENKLMSWATEHKKF